MPHLVGLFLIPSAPSRIEFGDGKAPIDGGYACVTTVISSLKLRLPISLVSQLVDPPPSAAAALASR